MNQNDLKIVQKVQLELLIAFRDYCDLNNLNYHIYSGTLLGAVRHKGFIPWDDDVDVYMPREDYDFFTRNWMGHRSGIFLQNYETDPQYFHHFTRLRKNYTLALQVFSADLDIHHGVFIDVFPLDKVPTDIKLISPFLKRLGFLVLFDRIGYHASTMVRKRH